MSIIAITNRLKKLELVKGQVNEIAIVDKFLALIELSIEHDPILEIPDFQEFRLSHISGKVGAYDG